VSKYNPGNERIKRRYFTYLKEARRHEESTIDASAKALNRWEQYTKFRDFGAFHFEQAVGFKRHLSEQVGTRSGERLSKATLHATMTQLKRFFQWLALQPGFKTKIKYCDADYFNLSVNEIRVATARRTQKWPTLVQIQHVLRSMPKSTDIELRNRALLAFTILTGARDRATASMNLKHIDLLDGRIDQDGREVKTKYRKTFHTYFFPVGEEITRIIKDWVIYLREVKLWGNEDPLFPSTQLASGRSKGFEVIGLERAHWSNTTPIRKIFRAAFINAGLPYFNPHSFRNTLAQLGEILCRTPEQFKAWSQNLGHEQVLTTFVSYGEVACGRQREIISNLAKVQNSVKCQADEIADAILERFSSSGAFGPRLGQ